MYQKKVKERYFSKVNTPPSLQSIVIQKRKKKL